MVLHVANDQLSGFSILSCCDCFLYRFIRSAFALAKVQSAGWYNGFLESGLEDIFPRYFSQAKLRRMGRESFTLTSGGEGEE